MIIKEFRIPMPLTVEEYQRGQVYAVAESAKRETGGGDGIEILKSEPFEDVLLPNGMHLDSGQYTLKKYHINNKVPGFVRLLTPKGALDLREECWNSYPYSRTTITNDYLGERFNLTVESIHLPDKGDTENALNLTPEQLKAREVVIIDIGQVADQDDVSLSENENPRRYKSSKTLRGPLGQDWIHESPTIMCCYKLVTCEFKVFGLQNRLENFIQKNEQHVFATYHRRMFCWIDQWYDMTLEEARMFEEDVARGMDEIRENGTLRGLKALE